MKVCILSPSVQKHMVLVSLYTKYFEENGILYDFIYPDKYHEEEFSTADSTYRFEVNNSKNQIVTIIDYFKFIRYAKNIIRNNKYDLVIVWTEVAAAIFSRFLSKEINGKYIVVVLDLFNEKRIIKNYYILKRLLDKAIEHAAYVTVSSPGYIKYLTSKRTDYIFVHNINLSIMPKPDLSKKKESSPIRILYCGHISYPGYAKKMIKRFCNDNRFFMYIIGAGSEEVKPYADEIGCMNIEFGGKFESKETETILKKGDIIYNVYGNDFYCEQTALSNKLYYAVSMCCPILVSPGTYMSIITEKLGIGFTIDFDSPDDICTILYEWYQSFEQSDVIDKCGKFKEDALQSQKLIHSKLDVYLNKNDV